MIIIITITSLSNHHRISYNNINQVHTKKNCQNIRSCQNILSPCIYQKRWHLYYNRYKKTKKFSQYTKFLVVFFNCSKSAFWFCNCVRLFSLQLVAHAMSSHPFFLMSIRFLKTTYVCMFKDKSYLICTIKTKACW